MAFCTNCGQELPLGANFCPKCGTATKETYDDVARRKTVYDGELHKCPNCGELIDSFVTTCPSCNYELRGAKAPSIVREFADKLEQIEHTREPQKLHSLIGMLYGSDGRINKTDEQKINLIRSFSIPNTKEDVFEFAILAASNIDLKLYGLGNSMLSASQRAVSDAWYAKFEQAYEKASLLFASAPDFMVIKNIHDKKIKQLKRKKLEIPIFILGIIVLFRLYFLLIGNLIS